MEKAGYSLFLPLKPVSFCAKNIDVVTNRAPSRASPLPQVMCVEYKFDIHHNPLWERACSRLRPEKSPRISKRRPSHNQPRRKSSVRTAPSSPRNAEQTLKRTGTISLVVGLRAVCRCPQRIPIEITRAIRPTSSNSFAVEFTQRMGAGQAPQLPFAQNSAFGPGPGAARKFFSCAASSLPVSINVPRSCRTCSTLRLETADPLDPRNWSRQTVRSPNKISR